VQAARNRKERKQAPQKIGEDHNSRSLKEQAMVRAKLEKNIHPPKGSVEPFRKKRRLRRDLIGTPRITASLKKRPGPITTSRQFGVQKNAERRVRADRRSMWKTEEQQNPAVSFDIDGDPAFQPRIARPGNRTKNETNDWTRAWKRGEKGEQTPNTN